MSYQFLMEVASKLGTHLVVIGASGHTGLRNVFFGSTTREMVEQFRFPLFVYRRG